jgi:hypothetical protein
MSGEADLEHAATLRLVRAKRVQDLVFGVIGILVLIVVMGLLVTLVADLLIDGVGRISPEFLTSFPSRRAAGAGVLSAWIGTTLVMLVTAAIAVPLGVGAGLYLEEYAAKNILTDAIEINVSNLAGVPSIIYGAAVPTITPSNGPGSNASFLGLNLVHATIVRIVTTPAMAARWWTDPSIGKMLMNASGRAAMLANPLDRGASSSITWSCDTRISTPIPASIPWITEGEIARNHWPSLNTPASSCRAPIVQTVATRYAGGDACDLRAENIGLCGVTQTPQHLVHAPEIRLHLPQCLTH